jgi:hypothetical protein
VSGYRYGDYPPTQACPYCGTRCDADFVDIGVGMQQCGPYHCQACGASEIGPNDDDRPLSADEQRTGWYEPGKPPGSSANVIDGRVVSYAVMRDTYRAEFVGNPLWHDEAYVREWWEKTRHLSQPDTQRGTEGG